MEKEVDKKYHYCWFTAEQVAPMVGLDVDGFLGKQDLILTEFSIAREPNKDCRDAFPSKCGQLYSPRPKKKSEARETRSRPVPRIDMQLMAGAVMQLRQHWPLLLEARSRYSGGRAVCVCEWARGVVYAQSKGAWQLSSALQSSLTRRLPMPLRYTNLLNVLSMESCSTRRLAGMMQQSERLSTMKASHSKISTGVQVSSMHTIR